MNLSAHDELYARVIGWQVLEYLRQEHPGHFAEASEQDAIRVLEKIKLILDDDTLDDPECFTKIEYIVETFHANGLSTTRHDWC